MDFCFISFFFFFGPLNLFHIFISHKYLHQMLLCSTLSHHSLSLQIPSHFLSKYQNHHKFMPLFLSKSFLFLPTRPFSSISNFTSYMMSSFSPTKPKTRLRGVVFDMDGTLTVPVIDFPAMYRTVLGEDEYKRVKAENPTGIDILHHIENWSPDLQRHAYQTIADFERQGLDRLQIMPGGLFFFLMNILYLFF